MVTLPMTTPAMVPRKDYLAIALEQPRAAFVAACGFPFLLAERPFDPYVRASPTEVITDFRSLLRRRGDEPTQTLSLRSESVPDAAPLPLLALAKTQPHFPSMIAVGRTGNNDVVIPDPTVSKFHAFFKVDDGRFALADAGSRNGTFVAGERLPVRGAFVDVALGAAIRFGRVSFRVVDAGAAWDAARRSGAQEDW